MPVMDKKHNKNNEQNAQTKERLLAIQHEQTAEQPPTSHHKLLPKTDSSEIVEFGMGENCSKSDGEKHGMK